jgi:hypothetical protein
MIDSSSGPNNISVAEWKGCRSTRIERGRRHIKSQDELDFMLSGKDEHSRGKKLFYQRYSSHVLNPYGSTKIFPDKYKKSDNFDNVELKKY